MHGPDFERKTTMKILRILLSSLLVAILAGQMTAVKAQTSIVSLNFDPQKDGLAFKNYPNNYNTWTDDLGAEDLIRMFGVRAVCKGGTNASNCVPHASAKTWLDKRLAEMAIGHCEGIAVASLRMNSKLPFKGRTTPAQFQAGAKLPFDLRFDQTLQNYISYYWITQTFPEIKVKTEMTAAAGPIAIVQQLIDSMNGKNETFVLGMRKFDSGNGRISDGHAVAPFKVEDIGSQYKIHVYDNNYPGATRYIFVNKSAAEEWSYSSRSDNKPDYVGKKSTKTLELTATSWRDGICFGSSFERDISTARGCGEGSGGGAALFSPPSFRLASFAQDDDGEQAEFFLTGDGDMLVSDGGGRRVGYDPKTDAYYDEIPDGIASVLNSGLGLNVPNYIVPYEFDDGDYTIVFSGKYLDAESNFDFVFSAPGFTVGFDGIRLDPNETLTARISANGEEISFTASADGETPDVFYSMDPNNDSSYSYLARIGGIQLDKNRSLTYNFDLANGKLFFSDDDGNEDNYDIDLIRLSANGATQEYRQDDLDIGKADRYEMDFGAWDGKGKMCFKADEDGDGDYDEETCTDEPNEKPR